MLIPPVARKGRHSPQEVALDVENDEPEPLPEFFRKAIKAGQKERQAEIRPIRSNPTTSTMDYDDEERVFLMTVDQYKGRTGRQFLTNTEMFAIMRKELGYVKAPPKPEDE